jgi:hypothetical protein
MAEIVAFTSEAQWMDETDSDQHTTEAEHILG